MRQRRRFPVPPWIGLPICILCVGFTCGPASDAPEASDAAAAPTSEEARTLYALGAAASRPLESFDLSPDEADRVADGFRDALRGEELAAQPEDYRGQIQALQTERRRRAADAEREHARAFVASAAEREGAVRTPSGLVYEELEPGDGASPGVEDTVVVHYHGTLRDGSVFDSSVDRGSPVRFPLGRVIPCWQEALQRMKVGGRARITCPPEIAYGDMGAPPRIPGGAALQFEVQLLEIADGSGD